MPVKAFIINQQAKCENPYDLKHLRSYERYSVSSVCVVTPMELPSKIQKFIDSPDKLKSSRPTATRAQFSSHSFCPSEDCSGERR